MSSVQGCRTDTALIQLRAGSPRARSLARREQRTCPALRSFVGRKRSARFSEGRMFGLACRGCSTAREEEGDGGAVTGRRSSDASRHVSPRSGGTESGPTRAGADSRSASCESTAACRNIFFPAYGPLGPAVVRRSGTSRGRRCLGGERARRTRQVSPPRRLVRARVSRSRAERLRTNVRALRPFSRPWPLRACSPCVASWAATFATSAAASSCSSETSPRS